ncbi:hypothetical protein KDV73_22320, partial [Providencia stuartii]
MKIKVENLGFISSGEININNLTVIFGKNNVGKTYLSYATYGILREMRAASSVTRLLKKSDMTKLKNEQLIEVDISKISPDHFIKEISKKFNKNLNTFFSAKEDFFKDSKVEAVTEFDFLKLKKIEISYNFQLDGIGLFVIKKNIDSDLLLISLVPMNDEEGVFAKFDDDTMSIVTSSIIMDKFFKEVFEEVRSSFVITSERTGVSLFYKEMDSYRSSLVNQIFKNSSGNIVTKKISKYSTP